MRPRFDVFPARLLLQRQFHFSPIRRAENHYETLGVPIEADAKDIKKSFYSLSRIHHPDHNPNDPAASARFIKISEAYAILGSPEKRQLYNRDVLHTEQASANNATRRGSYSSSGPAGGRPASGLSRRRTRFHGPPPSFFRNGAWGSQNGRRQAAAAEEASANAQAAGEHAHQGSQEGGMGPGQTPFGNMNDVPHFDREGHFRTHTANEKRRRNRTTGEEIPNEPGRSTLGDFIFVSSIISLGVFVPSVIFERLTRKPKAEK